MRTAVLVGAACLSMAIWGCSSTTPVSPRAGVTESGGGGNVTTISILGADSSGSFQPNPAPVAQGSLMAWQNTDGETHRIVATDNSFDTGDLVSGQTSAPIVLSTNGATYFCSIHPSERGSILTSTGAIPGRAPAGR